jgi:hypothetical protein
LLDLVLREDIIDNRIVFCRFRVSSSLERKLNFCLDGLNISKGTLVRREF